MDRHQRQLQKAAAAPITFPFRRQPFCAYQAADPDAWNKCQQREYDCQKSSRPYGRACHIDARAHIPPLSLRSRTIRGLNKGHRGVEVRHSQNGYALLQLTASMRVGDKYVAGGSPIAIEGAAPDNRVVILQFESMDKLKAWWDSSSQKDIRRPTNGD
jgi:uncharacterized protein (DUF1330 family)